MSRYGASTFSSLLKDCVLWAPLQHSAGVSGDIDEFPIIPSGVTVTNGGTFTKSSLGNNKSVLNFDGSTNYISLSDNDAWAFWDSNFTVGMWFRKNTTHNTIFIKQTTDLNNQITFWYISSSNQISLYIKVNGIENASYVWNFTPSLNVWYHFTIVRSGSTCLIYINGNPQTPSTIYQAFRNTSNIGAVLRIGSDLVNYHNGNIKDFMIFKGRALTQPEIKLLMNRTHPITGAGLMPANGEYWRLS